MTYMPRNLGVPETRWSPRVRKGLKGFKIGSNMDSILNNPNLTEKGNDVSEPPQFEVRVTQLLMKIPRPVNLIKWRSSYSDRGEVLSVEFDIQKDGILRIRIVPENGTGGREGGRGKEGTAPLTAGWQQYWDWDWERLSTGVDWLIGFTIGGTRLG